MSEKFKAVVSRVVAVAMLTAMLSACGGKSESDLLALAKNSLAKREYAAATIHLKSILQMSPSSPEARFLLGRVMLEQGDYASALTELNKSKDLGFDDGLVSPKLARTLLATGKFREVLSGYAAKEVKPASAQAELRTALAMAHALLGQRAEADAAIADALTADSTYPWALLTKARFLAAGGKVDDALALIAQAIVPGVPSGDAYLLRGNLLRYAKKDIQAAVEAYQKAALDPQEALFAHGALIDLYLSQNKVADAKAQLAQLLKSHPKSSQALYLDGVVAYAAKDFARAESIAERLLRLQPNSPQLLVLGGASNLQRGALIAAEAKLGKVVQTVERASGARKVLAETYLRMGQPEKSLATLRPLLEQGKPDGDALQLAGQAQLQNGNFQEAEAMFAEALKLKPQDAQLRTALAMADLVKGNSEAAFAAMADIASKDSGESADLALISAHLRRREFDAALAAIVLLEKKLPTKPTAAHLRGVALSGKGDSAGARAAFDAALKLEPTYYASVAALVSLDLQDKKPDAAQRRLEAAIKLNPRNTDARMALLDQMVRRGAKPEAILASIDDAIKAAPDQAAPRVAKIQHFSRMKDVKAAASAAQDAMAALPQQAAVLDAAGRALSNAGDEQQALNAFNKLASVTPGSALPFLRLADVHAKKGDVGAVSSALGRAFEVAPRVAEVHERLLLQATKTKDYKPVLSAAKQLQTRWPTSAVGFLLEGDAEAARKSWPGALAAYRVALAKADGKGRPQRLVYSTLHLSGDKAGAERFAAEWLRAHPREIAFTDFLASQALLRKDLVLAERYFREVLAAQPKSGSAMNNIAWLMAERGAKGAVEMAEKALALAPDAATLMDTLAKALASEGQLERAIEVQKKAIAAVPERSFFRTSLIRLYIKAGKKAEARAELDALLKRSDKQQQSPAEIAELRKELER